MDDNCSNILLLNLNHIGDVLFTTPAIRALREHYPEAKITAVVLTGLESLLEHNPCVDEVIGRRRGLGDTFRLRPRIRCQRDTGMSVLFSFSSFQLAAMGWIAGAGTRIGFDDPEVRKLLTVKVHRNQSIHRADSFLDLARAVGADLAAPSMEMFVGGKDREFAKNILSSSGVTGDRPVAAISPGSSVAAKEWYPERYAALADRLSNAGMDVIIVGSASERATIDRVLGASKSNLIDLAGKTTVGQLSGVLEKCDVVVSNDTGPMHLAVAVGAPTAAIFGPTDPRVYGPYNPNSTTLWKQMPCSGCGNSTKCSHRECLQSITVDMAFDVASELAAQRMGRNPK